MRHLHRRRPLRRRLTDHLAALGIAALAYPLVRYGVQQDRKAGVR